ncbi:MAG: hypothetical protein AAGJ32_00340 [Pseudomonadota bacterium]
MILALLAETSASGDKSEAAFPPFDPWHWPSQAFWLIVTFGLLYLVLSRAILPKFATTIERRGNQIANDLDEAANLNEQAAEANQALELELANARVKARATAVDAQSEMEAEIASESAKVEAALERQMAEAAEKIDALRTEAMSNVETIAAETAQAMAARLGLKATAKAAKSAVKSALSQS